MCAQPSDWSNVSRLMVDFIEQEHARSPTFEAYLGVLTLASALNFGGNYVKAKPELLQLGLPLLHTDKDLDIVVFEGASLSDGTRSTDARLRRLRSHLRAGHCPLKVLPAARRASCERYCKSLNYVFQCSNYSHEVGNVATHVYLSKATARKESFNPEVIEALPYRIDMVESNCAPGFPRSIDLFYFKQALPRNTGSTVEWEGTHWPMPADTQMLVRTYYSFSIVAKHDADRHLFPALARTCLPQARLNDTLCGMRLRARCAEFAAAVSEECFVAHRASLKRSVDKSTWYWSPNTCNGCAPIECRPSEALGQALTDE